MQNSNTTETPSAQDQRGSLDVAAGSDSADAIVKTLRALCVGTPAKIKWPHYELHEAIRVIEELNRDRKRLDWLQDNCAMALMESEDEGSLPDAKIFVPKLQEHPADDAMECIGRGDDFREAIDDAMGQIARPCPNKADSPICKP